MQTVRADYSNFLDEIRPEADLDSIKLSAQTKEILSEKDIGLMPLPPIDGQDPIFFDNFRAELERDSVFSSPVNCQRDEIKESARRRMSYYQGG